MASSRFLLRSLLLPSLAFLPGASASDVNDCSCGFYDPSTDYVLTDSLIVYFNESQSLDEFVIKEYSNPYEKSWNSKYRQGAVAENVGFPNDTRTVNSSLNLFVDKWTEDHVVNGGEIRTKRQDVHYGSIRALIKSPPHWAGGSSMTMKVEYNDTESLELNVMNTDHEEEAWVSTLISGEWPERSLGTNYSVVNNASLVNSSVTSPWNFTEYRIDWSKDWINFTISGNTTRVISKHDKQLPSVPGPLTLKHWSTGNTYTSEGPPMMRSVASVGWVRMFFNTTAMTEDEREAYDERCRAQAACSMEDTALRGQSPYALESTEKWKQKHPGGDDRKAAIGISVVCIATSALLLAHAVLRKKPTPFNGTRPPSPAARARGDSCSNSNAFPATPRTAHFNSEEATLASGSATPYARSAFGVPAPRAPGDDDADAIRPPAKKRIDYLAGLVALCSVVVTVMHFCLTFIPAAVMPGSPAHYPSELWARTYIAPFVLNQMWLGVFFTTSTRFLTSRYLKEGELSGIAERATRRTPRLMIPVATWALVEYFLIDIGATHWLEYVPSVTWSTWPYVTRYPNFGHYLSAILELVYLIPNAVPQVTLYYCTGVLWTIAVQLQFSWMVLMAAIVIREVKTPWKRFSFYAYCVVVNWYAQTWGAYLWLGLLLTDLDVTYKYRKWLFAKPWTRYYPLLWLCMALVVIGFTANMLPQWIPQFNFSIIEYGFHPDLPTGLALGQTERAGYPPYYVPRLTALFFAVGMQAIVELNPTFQKFLSFRYFVMLFPHIFTIYLVHGLVFWSWGAWLITFLAAHGAPYWANSLAVGLSSYFLLGCSLPIVTPIIELLGVEITKQVWHFAHNKPEPRRKTIFPYRDDTFIQYEDGAYRRNTPEESVESLPSQNDRRDPVDEKKSKFDFD
ncbi:hypothetical protein BDY21DRAFT_287004 [Lineolata rhizophorae]|uniref:GH16 domain-containing protein n=1 Tax=Lineolata rhizophorae TaxID=578093 RepID=A0A6A6NZ21_9PEZI|nr:hypothetical protein BDY21DRAFT_287004 [Lineolata rhizophorae]